MDKTNKTRNALLAITVGRTTTLWGRVVTRWTNGFELDTLGRSMLSLDAAAEALAGAM